MKELKFTTNTISTYGLALALLRAALVKSTQYDSESISSIIFHHPLMAWMYSIMKNSFNFSLIEVTELTAAFLLSIRPVSEKLSFLEEAQL